MNLSKKIQILFVSKRADLRGILAAACLSHIASDRFAGYFCGRPGNVSRAFQPAAIEVLQKAGMQPPGGGPVSWSEPLKAGSPRMDIVITLDAGIATEQPAWPGQPATALWHFPDLLAGHLKSDALTREAGQMLHALRRRLELLTNLALHTANKDDVRNDVRSLAFLP
jgi:protein-tyrosine-phosphatase